MRILNVLVLRKIEKPFNYSDLESMIEVVLGRVLKYSSTRLVNFYLTQTRLEAKIP